MLTHRTLFLVIFLICLFLLGYALYLEKLEGQEPCPLCLVQRLFFALTGSAAMIAYLHHPKKIGTIIYSAAIALFTLCGAIIAGRQVWLQHLPADQVPACGPGLEYMMQRYPFAEVVIKLFKGSGECAEVTWRLVGLSIAEWSLLIFSMLLVSQILSLKRINWIYR